MVVYNETSSGVLSPIQAIRKVIDDVGHPALLMVDAIASIGSARYEHDAWGVDVTVTCSQKGLMLPPGLGLIAVSERAVEMARATRTAVQAWGLEVLAATRPRILPC